MAFSTQGQFGARYPTLHFVVSRRVQWSSYIYAATLSSLKDSLGRIPRLSFFETLLQPNWDTRLLPIGRTFTQQLTVSKSEWQGPNEPWNQRNKPASGKRWLAGACQHAKHTLTAQVVHLLWCALPRASLEIMMFHVFLRSVNVNYYGKETRNTKEIIILSNIHPAADGFKIGIARSQRAMEPAEQAGKRQAVACRGLPACQAHSDCASGASSLMCTATGFTWNNDVPCFSAQREC